MVDLLQILHGEPDRKASYDGCLASAAAYIRVLPLVHRTGRPDQSEHWTNILKNRMLRVSDQLSQEEEACGWGRAAYFFLGSAAYPKGNVAFVLGRGIVDALRAMFTPFDTGALSRGFLSPRFGGAWTLEDRTERLRRYTGDFKPIDTFAATYIAAHFKKPESYTLAEQHSAPDFGIYHELYSPTNDRRAWTIEVRVHGNVSLVPDNPEIEAIILSNKAYEADIPDDFCGALVIADSDGEGEDGDIAKATANMILTKAKGNIS